MRSLRWQPAALAVLAPLLLAAPAGAATFRVTAEADVSDPTPDGVCDTCSLREAVQEASETAEDDTIEVPRGSFGLTSGELETNAGNGKFTIVGAGARATAIDGGGLDRVFHVPANSVLELSALTVRKGMASGSAGAILSEGSLSLTDVAITGNQAADGGGISTIGTLTLVRSTVSGNIATGAGGGIYALRVSNQQPGTVTLTNSTVSGNRANGAGAGIGSSDGTVTLRNSTITGNDGGTLGGRGLDLDGATATASNSVIAGNPRGDCRDNSGSVAIFNQGGNLSSDAKCGFGVPVDVRLGPLADNGGGTDTHALLTGSPAIDAGSGPGCPATDQRGVPRPQGQACDSGAFEAAPVAVTGPPADTVAPLIAALKVSNPVFRVNRAGRAAQARREASSPILRIDRRGRAAKKRRVPKGTRFRFRLSESAGVSFAIELRTSGRRVGSRCRATTKRNGARPRCVRWVAVRRFVRARVAGANSVPFSGRISRGHKVRALEPGRYRASIRATDAADNRSKVARVSFRVVR